MQASKTSQEEELINDVFNDKRIQRMHTRARNHQEALSPSDAAQLRDLGVTLNKSLLHDYSKQVSRDQQQGKESPHFVKWLNVKTSPTMAEIPSMSVLQYALPGQAVQTLRVSDFAESAGRYGKLVNELSLAPSTTDEDVLVAKASDRVPSTKKKASASPVSSLDDGAVNQSDLFKLKKENQKLLDQQNTVDEIKRQTEMVMEQTRIVQEKSHGIQQHKSTVDEIKRQTEMVRDQTRIVQEKSDAIQHHKNQMHEITKHLRTTGARASVKNACDTVKKLCEDHIQLKGKYEALLKDAKHSPLTMSDGKKNGIIADSLRALQISKDQVDQHKSRADRLEAANDVLKSDLEDLKAHINANEQGMQTVRTQLTMMQNKATKHERIARAEAASHDTMAQKLACALHHGAVDEEGEGNASVFLSMMDCCCGKDPEFEEKVLRNERQGAIVLGRTAENIADVEPGETLNLVLANVSGLKSMEANAAGPVEVIKMKRLSNDKDGNCRALLMTPLSLGDHTVQNEVTMANKYYELKINPN